MSEQTESTQVFQPPQGSLCGKYIAAGSVANLAVSAMACAAAYIVLVLLFPKSRRLVLELLSIARSQLGFAPAT